MSQIVDAVYRPSPSQQILVGVPAVLTATLSDATGEPVAGLTATVTIARANGTVLHTAQAATDNGDGTYSYTLAAADVALLDILTATWTVSGATRATTRHEIVGGYYFTRGDVDTAEQGRGSDYGPDFEMIRAEVETECERIAGGRAFVPRYRRRIVDGTGTASLDLRDPDPRTIRSIKQTVASGTVTDWPGNITDLVLTESGMVIAPPALGVVPFLLGYRNIIVEYEYGWDRPPVDLKRAAIRRFRTRLHSPRSGVPDNALSYTAQNGATYRIATADPMSTGDTDIDAIYQAYRFKKIKLA